MPFWKWPCNAADNHDSQFYSSPIIMADCMGGMTDLIRIEFLVNLAFHHTHKRSTTCSSPCTCPVVHTQGYIMVISEHVT